MRRYAETFGAVVLLVEIIPSAVLAGKVEGRPELMREAAYALQQNSSKLQTWQGNIRRSSEIYNVANPRPGDKPDGQEAADLFFAQDRVRNIFRTDIDETTITVDPAALARATADMSPEQRNNLSPPESMFNRVILQNGDAFRYSGKSSQKGDGQLIIQQEADVRNTPFYFDPARCFGESTGRDNTVTFEALTHVADVMADPKSLPENAIFKVEKKGDCVEFTIKNSAEPGAEIYVYDLSKGGNLVSRHNTDPRGISEDTTIAYQEQDGVWVPVEHLRKLVTVTSDHQPQTIIERATLIASKVNQPIDPSVFMIESLGIQPGNIVADWRHPKEPIAYYYSGEKGMPQQAIADVIQQLATRPASRPAVVPPLRDPRRPLAGRTASPPPADTSNQMIVYATAGGLAVLVSVLLAGHYLGRRRRQSR